MEKQKADRLEIEHRVLLSERLPALKKILESYVSTLPANALHPNTGELFRNPAVRDMVYNKEEYESLDSVVKLLPDVTAQWLKEIREQLLDMIKVARPDYTFDSDTVLDLATTVFRCTECNITLRYPVVLMHSCAFRKGYGYFPTSTSLEESILHNAIQETYWNKLDHIVYKENYAKAMSETLEMAGFDPTTTTGTEMDNLNPVFECVGCNSHSEGRLTMQWIAAVCSYNTSFALVSKIVYSPMLPPYAGRTPPEASLWRQCLGHGAPERRRGCHCTTKNPRGSG